MVESMENSALEREILSYLIENPDAHDTLEGIAHWWLLDRAIRAQTSKVEAALERLLSQGLVVKVERVDSEIQYRINRQRLDEILALLKNRKPSNGK